MVTRTVAKKDQQNMPKTGRPGNRLGNYLVTGSFQPGIVKTVPKPVRRNRIIFVVVISLLVVFTLIWLL